MQNCNEHHSNNVIHQTAIIDPTVTMGTGNYIGPYTIIGPDVKIGDNNTFTAHCSVGTPPQHRSHPGGKGEIIIGSQNVIREYVTVHRPTEGLTRIDSNCYFMACAHVPHDAWIEDDVTMCNNVLLGGHTRIMIGATVGLGSVVHQYQVIGSYSMIGMGSVVPKGATILPGKKYAGNPVKELGLNEVGLKRNGVTEEKLRELTDKFWKFKEPHK